MGKSLGTFLTRTFHQKGLARALLRFVLVIANLSDDASTAWAKDLPDPNPTPQTNAATVESIDGEGKAAQMWGDHRSVAFLAGAVMENYTDQQSSAALGLKDETEVQLSGFQFGALFNHGDYFYSEFSATQLTTDKDYWQKQTTISALLGWTIPITDWLDYLAIVSGVYWQFNELILESRDSPEVAASGIRAYILGIDGRFHIWQPLREIGLFALTRIWTLNQFAETNKGFEAIGGIGFTWADLPRVEVSLVTKALQYDGTEEGTTQFSRLEVKAKTTGFGLETRVWL